jgi:hypothetical protein
MARMSELEEKKIACPDCGSTELSRIYGSFNFIPKMDRKGPECPHSHICGANCRH